jgi:ribonucleoside-triphosphate reductase
MSDKRYEMNPSNKLLSDITAFRTYAKYIPHIGRRESLEETINRSLSMDLQQFPKLSGEIVKAYALVHDLKVMPSMRKLQFAGDAILKNNARQYNCSYLPIDDTRAFGETLYLLLSGTGVGFSVQARHVERLPKVQQPREEGVFYAHDSIQGWAQCVEVLMNAYFYGQIRPVFDFSQIRPKGSYLVTTGAKAPGSEPLRSMLRQVEDILKKSIGRRLRPLEVHDLVCIISDCVLAGGIRRSALISLFDRWDEEMLKAKAGSWWEKAPWRARANNSAVLPRKETTKEEFMAIYEACKNSRAGEPGFYWTNDLDWGANPCVEIGLRPNQFCNLTTINCNGIYSKKEFLRRVRAATLLGTLQAAYTSFPYLRPVWQETTELDALLGVSMTGVADAGDFLSPEILEEGARLVLETNETFAKKIGIKLASRTTAIKPEGTASCVLGSSSGVHDRHDKYYIRRIRMSKDDALYKYLQTVIPSLCEDDLLSATGGIVSIPQESPEGSYLRGNTTADELFRRAVKFNRHWVQPGHRNGKNSHNVSVTISVKDDEWGKLGELLWSHRMGYTGISLLPADGGSYKQAPFEGIDEAHYNELASQVKTIELRNVMELEDNTNRTETVACAGGVCEIA